MNILFITGAFYPAFEYGGSTVAVFNQSVELVKLGHNVTVYATDAFDKSHRQKVTFNDIQGVKVYYFRNFNNYLSWHRISQPRGLRKSLLNEAHSFDIIHMHLYYYISNYFVHKVASSNGIPYVITPHNGPFATFPKRNLKRIFNASIGYKLLRDASAVIAQTKDEANQYVSMGISPCKITAVPYGIDIKEFKAVPSKGEFRKKYRIADEEILILYLGRIERVKGLDILVEAFSSLSTEIPHIKLVIVGPETDSIFSSQIHNMVVAKGLTDSVLFTGPLYGSEKLTVLADANLFVLPSRYEEFGLSPLEAYVYGLPVIVTDRCGVSEWMREQFDSVIPFDTNSLTVAIRETLTKTKIDSNTRFHRWCYINDNFSWEAITRKMDSLYHQFASKNG